jgi:capsid protein
MAMVNLDRFWAELEATGEAEVRKNLAAGAYGEWKIGPVEAWLREKEAVETHINDALQQKTARQAVVWSRNTALIAVVALCVSVIGLWLSYK